MTTTVRFTGGGTRIVTPGAHDILPPRSTDDEASALLDELDKLQTWSTLLMCRQVEGARAAYDLIQRTRILIIERCKR